jgi:hypothetical protein
VIAEIAKAGHLVVDALRTDRGAQSENAQRLMLALSKRHNGS